MHIPRRLQKGQGGTLGPQGGTDPITSLELGSSVHTPPGPPWVNMVLPRGQGRTQRPQRCEVVRTLRHPTGSGGGGRPHLRLHVGTTWFRMPTWCPIPEALTPRVWGRPTRGCFRSSDADPC